MDSRARLTRRTRGARTRQGARMMPDTDRDLMLHEQYEAEWDAEHNVRVIDARDIDGH
ncbi:hypothetical protein GCM10022287_23930 [Gryllotalpicola koreensis]|uniref:Uncharacterized protein n=1 Tax=Gryllotalpicola koreensis TaxID=993086 RepID=A0ABP8A2W3_9MICO